MDNPFDSQEITISKLDAARRQLKTAAEIWFMEGDEVSVLALAYASHEIIHRLFRNAGHSDLIYDSILVDDKDRADFNKSLKEVPNFFKHARNENMEDTIAFQPGIAAMFILMSAYALAVLEHKLNNAEMAVLVWFSLHFPSAKFIRSAFEESLPVDAFNHLTSHGRKHFYEKFVRIRGDQ